MVFAPLCLTHGIAPGLAMTVENRGQGQSVPLKNHDKVIAAAHRLC